MRSFRKLAQRLNKLEKRLAPKAPEVNSRLVWGRLCHVQPGDPEAVRRALEDLPTWQELIPTMDPEHVKIVLDTLANDENWSGAKTGRGRRNLAQTVYHALAGELSPLALPKVVAEVYLRDPSALPIHKCEACGYLIPTATNSKDYAREAYFTECPLCGGRIQWGLCRTSDCPVDKHGYAIRRPGNSESALESPSL